MGASLTFLEKPNTEVEYTTGESNELKIKFVAAEMQGWRLNMVSYQPTKKLYAGRRTYFKFGICQTVSTFCCV